ncbi:MAG TPA: dihydrodipicolinate synthase family protein [Verrucomicrobiota bacterium]|nr:dihydrodipicolinate synthase family protein [Verrucomicrobiota bacterium]
MNDDPQPPEWVRDRLGEGLVIPAHPLALTRRRTLDERRQRALTRYYLAAGAGGLAVGVHTTQFAIRDPRHGLLEPVLEIAARTAAEAAGASGRPAVLIAGICGPTAQAAREARLARALGYHAGLLSLGALRDAPERAVLAHCRAVAREIPLVGFYLQPAVGGRVLPFRFWRRFVEIENVVAIKIAPFNRYQTLDVVRAVAEAGRDDIALYTGNDDAIVTDLLTPFRFRVGGATIERRMVGGLLGHWAVWTRKAVELHGACRRVARAGQRVPPDLLRLGAAVTDANAALFDAANGFAGCIAGLHEILRRQGLMAGRWCLDARETLSAGQSDEIDRVCGAYPELSDDDFVGAHRDAWLR